MRSILINTDFSDESITQIRQVVELFSNPLVRTRLLLLNTYLVNLTNPAKVIELNDELRSKSKDGLESLKSDVMKVKSHDNLTIETISHMGTFRNVLSQLLEKEQINVVVLLNKNVRQMETVMPILEEKNCHVLMV